MFSAASEAKKWILKRIYIESVVLDYSRLPQSFDNFVEINAKHEVTKADFLGQIWLLKRGYPLNKKIRLSKKDMGDLVEETDRRIITDLAMYYDIRDDDPDGVSGFSEALSFLYEISRKGLDFKQIRERIADLIKEDKL